MQENSEETLSQHEIREILQAVGVLAPFEVSLKGHHARRGLDLDVLADLFGKMLNGDPDDRMDAVALIRSEFLDPLRSGSYGLIVGPCEGNTTNNHLAPPVTDDPEWTAPR